VNGHGVIGNQAPFADVILVENLAKAMDLALAPLGKEPR